jgi:hypothetical protein
LLIQQSRIIISIEKRGGAKMQYYEEPTKNIPIHQFDVVIGGGGTAGVVAAIASARNGAKTALIEAKGYLGGIATEGGTALHSYFNLWKAFPGVEKRQVVKGIAQEIIDRLSEYGGTTGHAEMEARYDYDSVCTAIDTELYKLVAFEMLIESGVHVYVNTLLVGAIMDGDTIRGVITESRAGREAFYAKAFVDSTGYGDLSAYAGADFTEPNDHSVANAMGVGGVDLERYYEFSKNNPNMQAAYGMRSGKPNRLVRVGSEWYDGLFPELNEEIKKIGLSFITTSTHDGYFMFIKLNYKMPTSPTNRDEVVKAELELRRRQAAAIKILRRIPGCENAFIARTSPSLSIRRGRCIVCDYDISISDVLDGIHFEDDIMSYGFHDSAPRMQIKDGGTYGIPYKALRVKGIKNLLAAGMLITSDWDAHMSTRNTVACFGQGQAAGTAAALCAKNSIGTRGLDYAVLRKTLLKDGVYLE